MKVALKKVELKHASLLAGLANSKKIWDNVRDFFPHPYTLSHADEFIRSKSNENPTNALGIFYINELVGIIGIDPMKDVFSKTGYLGYWIGESYWNKGIATEAVKLMCDYGFNEMQLIKIQAGVFDFNKSSMRVLDKAGFKLEGVLEKSVVKNEVICDDYIYGLVHPEVANNP